MSLNRLVLVLNASYEPITICSARRSLTLILKEAAVVEEVSDETVRTPHISIPLPNVIRLVRHRRVPRIDRSVSRKGIMLRDGFTCQYCLVKFPAGDLTLDHVIPRSRGGQSTWQNLASSCFICNNRKGDRTPEEAGMVLAKRPIQMNLHAKTRLLQGNQASWSKYMFA